MTAPATPPAPAPSPTDAERWRDFRHAAAEALDAAGIDGASRVVMNLPMPPTPPTDDGGAAFAAAVDALEWAVATDTSGVRVSEPEVDCAAARAHVLALHTAAVQTADAAGYARALAEERQPRGVVSAMAADDRLAAAHGRGYARAMDAACMALWDYNDEGLVTLSRSETGWFVEPETLWTPTPVDDAPTPTAAILAAAASLAPAPTAAPGLVSGGPPRDALDDGR